MRIQAVNGEQYEIEKRLGRGGVAKVFCATRVSDKKKFALKIYTAPTDKPELSAIHGRIRKNIKNLIDNPLLDKDGQPQSAFVPPLALVDSLPTDGFGYIMPLLDTKTYLPLKKLWHDDTYPDAMALCEAGKKLATLFDRIHFRGYCYKDVNEGNIYIDPKTGDVKVIDCDNIDERGTKTIFGTSGYIAPEVYHTGLPDEDSDKFSLATYFYRLLVGGYPLEGKRTERYLIDHEQNVASAGKVIYSDMALFAFDPHDNANSIRDVKSGFAPDQLHRWQIQTEYWDALPTPLKECFIKTFSDGLSADKKALRTTDRGWVATFDGLQRDHLIRCKCGKHNFDSRSACMFCGKSLTRRRPAKAVSTPTSPQSSIQLIRPAAKHELSSVRFSVLRDVEPSGLMATARRQTDLRGDQLHPELPASALMQIQYNAARDVLGAVNLSRLTWTVHFGGKQYTCPPGGRVILQKDMILTVLQRKLQLTVRALI